MNRVESDLDLGVGYDDLSRTWIFSVGARLGLYQLSQESGVVGF